MTDKNFFSFYIFHTVLCVEALVEALKGRTCHSTCKRQVLDSVNYIQLSIHITEKQRSQKARKSVINQINFRQVQNQSKKI